MSKGFADMLVASSRELDREIEREIKGIEVPYLEQGYRNWAAKYQKLEPSTIDKYVRHIKTVDMEFFTTEEDLFELLPEKITKASFDDVAPMFDRYIAIVTEWYELSKKKKLGLRPSTISNWRSALSSYRNFFIDYIIPFMKKRLGLSAEEVKPISVVESKTKTVFAENHFIEWMQLQEDMSYGSAHSYKSRLRSLNQEILLKNKKGVDYLALIPKYLQSGKPEKAMEILNDLVAILNNYFHNGSAINQPMLKKLRNYRAALSKYSKFIGEEMIDTVPDERTINDADKELVAESEQLIMFICDDLRRNFTFRIKTQNRMGENLNVFFPIEILRRLFRMSQKMSELEGVSNENYKWFNRWINDLVGRVEVVTERKRYTLAEVDFLSIDTKNKRVKLLLSNGDNSNTGVLVLTETNQDGAKPIVMEVSGLNEIHIDHTPLISQVLVEQAGNLPALARLTDMIKSVSKNAHLAIIAKNFSAIATKVFEDESRFKEMEQLIPLLKEELKLIHENTTLTLMAAEYNLRKKS